MPASDAAGSLTMPLVARDGDWFSVIGLVNLSSSSRTVTLNYSTPAQFSAGRDQCVDPGERIAAVDLPKICSVPVRTRAS